MAICLRRLDVGPAEIGAFVDRFGRRRTLFVYLDRVSLPVFYLMTELSRYGWVMPVSANAENRPAVPAWPPARPFSGHRLRATVPSLAVLAAASGLPGRVVACMAPLLLRLGTHTWCPMLVQLAEIFSGAEPQALPT
ncbi:MAG: hypothetical protein H7293_09855 [Candidatus Saccharibacteria bacterium]|nr:hypothetical protein [Rhodoferax sp.]